MVNEIGRAGFDVRTVRAMAGAHIPRNDDTQLVPATEVHAKLDQIDIPGIDKDRRPDVKPTRGERSRRLARREPQKVR